MYFTLTCLDSTFRNFKRLQNLLTSSTVTDNALIGEVNWKPEQLMKKVRDLYPDYDFRLELTIMIASRKLTEEIRGLESAIKGLEMRLNNLRQQRDSEQS